MALPALGSAPGGSKPSLPTPGGSGGGTLPPLGAAPGSSLPEGGGAKSKKKGGGLLHKLISGGGSVLGAVESAPSALGRVGVQLGKELFREGKRSNIGDDLLHPALFDAQKRAAIQAQEPVITSIYHSLGETARQIPDTAVGALEPGVGFGQTRLGQQVKREGVLNTTLAKAGDLSILLGGAGLAGKGLGLGRAAEISRLGEVAEAGLKAGQFSGIETAADAAKAASAAAKAGDVTRAANLSKIAETLGERESLLAKGPATLGERATKAAITGSKFGAHVAGAPAEVWVKGAGALGKGAMLIPGVEEAVAKARQALKDSKLYQARVAGKEVRHAARENITAEQARLNQGIMKGLDTAHRQAGGGAAEAAAILRHTGSADALAKLVDLPDEALAPLLEKHLGPGFTPEALRLAVNPTPEVEAAARTFSEQVVAPHEARQAQQYGNKGQLSDAALANRVHGIEHPFEPLPLGAAAETERLSRAPKARLAAVEEEARGILQQNLERRSGKLTAAGERTVARDQAVVKSIRRQVQKEEARAAATARDAARTDATLTAREGNRTGQVVGRGKVRMEEATQLKGTKGATSRGKMQARISRDSRLANVASTAEQKTAGEVLGREGRRQEGALGKAKAELDKAQERAGARAERLQSEADRRLVAADEKRLATLQDRRATLQGKIADAVEKAKTSDVATPAQTRALLLQSRGLAKDLREAGMGDAADSLPKSVADLKAAGVEPHYAPGGKVEERTPGSGAKQTAATASRNKLAGERYRATGTMPSTFEGMAKKLMSESRATTLNEFAPKMASFIGDKTGVRLALDVYKDHPELRGLKGEELSAALKEAGFHPWDPNGSGRLITGKALGDVHSHTPVIPEAYAGKMDVLIKVPDAAPKAYEKIRNNIVARAFDKATAGARTARLLEPAWQVKKTLGDPAMLAAMGVSPADIAAHLPAAIKKVLRRGGDLELTPGLGASAEGRVEMLSEKPATRLGRAGRSAANKMFTPFQKADAIAREVAYQAKLAEGFSPQAAAAEVRRGLGDLHHLTSAERNVAKRAFTFYPWQKHVGTTLLRLPLEHPAGTAIAAHALNQAKAISPEPKGAERVLGQMTNPLLSSVLTQAQLAGSPVKANQVVAGQLNPVVRALLSGGTGINGTRPLTMPKHYGEAGLGFAAAHPAEYARYLSQLVPLFKDLQNITNTQPSNGGALPERYNTGEPIHGGTKQTGAVKPVQFGPKSRVETLLKMLGWEPSEPKPKKKR